MTRGLPVRSGRRVIKLHHDDKSTCYNGLVHNKCFPMVAMSSGGGVIAYLFCLCACDCVRGGVTNSVNFGRFFPCDPGLVRDCDEISSGRANSRNRPPASTCVGDGCSDRVNQPAVDV